MDAPQPPDPPQEPPPVGRGAVRGRLLLLGATLGLLGLLLGAAEAVCRRLIPAPADTRQYRRGASPCYRTEFTLRGRVLAKAEPSEDGWFTEGDPTARSYPRARTAGVARLAVLGESSGEMLELRMNEVVSARTEVLRCAVPGGDPALVFGRVGEVAGYRPDAVVLAVGHNVRWRIPHGPTARWVAFLREHSRLAVALTGLRPPDDRTPDPAERLRFLSSELARFAAEMRRAHARPIYVLLPSNLRFAPAPPAGGERDPEVFAARLAWWQGRRDEAIARLTRAADGADVAQRHFELGEWLFDQGRFAEARARLVRARDLDPMPARVTTRITGMLRDAAARAGGDLYDLDALTTAHAPRGITGWESLIDNCHPTPFVLERAALDLLQLGACGSVAGACPAGRPRPDARPPSPPGWDHAVGGYDNRGEHPDLEIAKGLRNVLGQLLASGDGPTRASWALNLEQAVGAWSRELPAPALRAIVEQEQRDRLAHAPPDLRDLAVTALAAGLDRAGDRLGADDLLRDPITRDRSPDAWMLAGRRALVDGRPAEAARAFARAAALDPARADAPYYAAHVGAAP